MQTPPTPKRRARYYVDNDVQAKLLVRLVIYWSASLFFVTFPVAIFKVLLDPATNLLVHYGNVLSSHWQVLLMGMLLFPFLLVDTLRFSNRFVGPIFRLRRELRHFSESGELRKFCFRKNDFWQDIAEDMELVANQIDQLRSNNSRHQPIDSKTSPTTVGSSLDD